MRQSAKVQRVPSAAKHEYVLRAPKPLSASPVALVALGTDGKVLMEWSLDTLKEATGAAEHLAKYLFSQAVCGSGATLGLAEDQVYKLGAISEQLIAIAPQDPVEGMLAAQMVAVHNLAMNAFAKAARIIEQGPASAQRSQDPGIADRQLSRGLKLIAAFHRGLECLDRRRGKGQQRIIVEHIDQAAILVQGDLERK